MTDDRAFVECLTEVFTQRRKEMQRTQRRVKDSDAPEGFDPLLRFFAPLRELIVSQRA